MEELDRLEAEGVIVKCDNPTEWASSTVNVFKPDGQLRICLDQQALNR